MNGIPKRLLFVCTGNLCRSVMAEYLFKKIDLARDLGVEARSCGIAASENASVPVSVFKALAEEGIEHVHHRPTPISNEILAWSDLVLTMTRGHQQTVRAHFPKSAAKVFVLREYAGLPQTDVADPYGLSDAVYAACRDKIREALEAILDHAMA